MCRPLTVLNQTECVTPEARLTSSVQKNVLESLVPISSRATRPKRRGLNALAPSILFVWFPDFLIEVLQQ